MKDRQEGVFFPVSVDIAFPVPLYIFDCAQISARWHMAAEAEKGGSHHP